MKKNKIKLKKKKCVLLKKLKKKETCFVKETE